MKTIAADHAVDFVSREVHKTFPTLPAPVGELLLVELPVVSAQNEFELYVPPEVQRSLMTVKNQFLVVKTHDPEAVPAFSVIQCMESALFDVMTHRDVLNGHEVERRFAYVKAQFVTAIVPPLLSAFHEPARD